MHGAPAVLNFLIPELVERIDCKGPYFAGEGDFSSAGSARLRLADRLPSGIVSLTLGSNGYRRALLAKRDTPEDVRKHNGLLRYQRGSGDGGYTVTAMAYKNRWNATDQIPLRAVEDGRLGRFSGVDASDGGQASRYSLSYAMRKREAGRLVEVDAYAIASSLDLSSDFTYLLDNPGQGDQFTQSERRKLAGLNAAHSWTGTMGGVEVRNKLGLQARFDRLAPVGLYTSTARVRSGTVREDSVRQGSVEGFHSNDARGTTQTRLPSGEPADPVTPLVGTRGMELGARSELVRGLQSSLALWRLDIDSELLFVGDAGDTEPSRASRRHGIEWNNHYIAAPWLLFDLDLATSNARYRDSDPDGDDIPGSLGKVASFGVTVTDLGRWSAGFQTRYFGARPLIGDGSTHSGSTTLAYARLGYKLSRSTRLSLDVFNLFDRKASDIDYLYRSRLPGEPREGVEDIHFHPVEPRGVRLTLAHNF